ncbi:hypothetical protein FVE85_8326 [Porphyridium purpureum]|uniref:O-fucosyltransferase family protein n=1 Tax=Porphyridium purpureum TaxID=35688 RepID=A0A5J4YMA5_PORPP|nr:hypothetical protein FVE85_8326 [Porphyridium purpureum]|eukprot:POR7896..scf244_11
MRIVPHAVFLAAAFGAMLQISEGGNPGRYAKLDKAAPYDWQAGLNEYPAYVTAGVVDEKSRCSSKMHQAHFMTFHTRWGFGNQFKFLSIALQVAMLVNRTLVLPPITEHFSRCWSVGAVSVPEQVEPALIESDPTLQYACLDHAALSARPFWTDLLHIHAGVDDDLVVVEWVRFRDFMRTCAQAASVQRILPAYNLTSMRDDPKKEVVKVLATSGFCCGFNPIPKRNLHYLKDGRAQLRSSAPESGSLPSFVFQSELRAWVHDTQQEMPYDACLHLRWGGSESMDTNVMASRSHTMAAIVRSLDSFRQAFASKSNSSEIPGKVLMPAIYLATDATVEELQTNILREIQPRTRTVWTRRDLSERIAILNRDRPRPIPDDLVDFLMCACSPKLIGSGTSTYFFAMQKISCSAL